jgi:hypothetical protein
LTRATLKSHSKMVFIVSKYVTHNDIKSCFPYINYSRSTKNHLRVVRVITHGGKKSIHCPTAVSYKIKSLKNEVLVFLAPRRHFIYSGRDEVKYSTIRYMQQNTYNLVMCDLDYI